MNKLIIDTLSPLNIPVSFQTYSGVSNQYITFFFYGDKGELYEDDKEASTGYYVQIDIWSKGSYTNLVKEVKRLMTEAGFIKRPSGPELYEDDTKIYHKPLRFVLCENN